MFRNQFDVFARFDAEGNPGGGDGGDGSPDRGFERLLERNNQDGIALARHLYSENYQYRRDNNTLKDEIATLQGKAAPEGAIVLTGDDAAAWETYKALGEPDAVKQGLTEREELQGKLSSMERDTTLRTVAETAGYKPTVLARLEATARAEGKELAFEVREVEQDGQKSKVAFVKDGEAEKPLADYAASEWADFLPALTVTATPQGGNAQAQPGTRFPAQQPNAGGGHRPADPVGGYLQEQQEKQKQIKNPLLP